MAKNKLRQLDKDSIKELEAYFFKYVDDEVLDNKKVLKKFKEDCLVSLAENFYQLPASLLWAFETIAKDRLERLRDEML